MKSVVDCFVKCGFALTSLVPDEVLDGEKWMDHLPEFKAWIASLSEKTLYKHLLESLNVAAESDEGTGLIEQLSESDLASAVDAWTDLMHTWLLRWQISRRRATAAQRKIWKMNLFRSVLELISASY